MDKAVIIHQNLVCVHAVIANDFASALQEKIGCRVLIFNLCDPVNGILKRANYGRESGKLNPVIVANSGWEVAAPESPYPTLDHLFRIVYAVHAWLNLSPTNKALLACPNGRTRTCIVASVFLKYTCSVPCCLNGVMQFYKSVRPPIRLTEEDIRSKPLLKAFLESVDTLVDTRRYPYPTSHSISTIFIEGLFVEESPEIEVWSAGKCAFSSEDSAKRNCDWDYEDATAIYDINTIVQGDVAVVVKLKDGEGGKVHEKKGASYSNSVVFRYLTNTGLTGAGLIEVQRSNISIAHPEDEEFFDEDFKLSILFHREPSIDFRLPEIVQCGTEIATRRGISEIISWRTSGADSVLVEMVAKKIERMATLEGVDFALLLANNNTAEAIKILRQFRLEQLYSEAHVGSSTSEIHKINGSLNFNWPFSSNNAMLQRVRGNEVSNGLPLDESSEVAAFTDLNCAQYPSLIPKNTTNKSQDKIELTHEKSSKIINDIKYCDGAADMFSVGQAVAFVLQEGNVARGQAPAQSYTKGNGVTPSESQTLSTRDGSLNFGATDIKDGIESSSVGSQRVRAKIIAPASISFKSESRAAGKVVQKCNSLEQHHDGSSVDSAAEPRSCGEGSTPRNTSKKLYDVDLASASYSIDPSDPGKRAEQQIHRKRSFEVEKSTLFYGEHSSSETSSEISVNKSLCIDAPVATNPITPASWTNLTDGTTATAEFRTNSRAGIVVEIDREVNNEDNKQSRSSRTIISGREVGMSKVECQANGAGRSIKTPMHAQEWETMPRKCKDIGGVVSQKGELGDENGGYSRFIDGTGNLDDHNCAALRRFEDRGAPVKSPGSLVNVALTQSSPPEDQRAGLLQSQPQQKVFEDCNLAKNENNTANTQVTPVVPTDKEPELSAPDKGTSEPAVAIKDDPRFSKYFKMLKMHVPKGAVVAKMTAEGLDPAVLDMDPELPAPDKGTSEPTVAIKDDPRFSKYFKMLKMHVPKGAVVAKMTAEGLDPAVLDMDPELPAPDKGTSEPTVAIKDDPRFSKYFKMLKMHVPKGAVVAKMTAEGLDPAVLDMDPELPSPNDHRKKSKAASEVKDKFRRKRLHWRSIDQSRLQADTIWSTLQEDHASCKVVIDDGEFEDLFIEKVEKVATKDQEVKRTKPETTKIQIIEGKRAMNGAIALARVRIDFSEIATALRNLRGAAFTADQLVTLTEFLPTDEETTALSNYLRGAGDVNRLGETDRFMIQMMGVSDTAKRYRCLTTQKRFATVRNELSRSIKVIQRACNDVKSSIRLKRLLAVVLKLGNKLNVGANQVEAFTLDSLIKLKDAKAFDKKTSVMQFMIRLVQNQEPDTLDFRNDLANVLDASQVSISTIQTDIEGLSSDIAAAQLIINDDCGSLEFDFSKGSVPSDTQMEVISYPTFIHAAHIQMEALRNELNSMQREYLDVLDYFGEDPKLDSQDFFRSLNEFGSSFEKSIQEVNEAARLEALRVRRLRAEEERRTKLDAQQASDAKLEGDARTLIIEKARGMRSMTRPDSSGESSDSSDNEGSFD